MNGIEDNPVMNLEMSVNANLNEMENNAAVKTHKIKFTKETNGTV